MKCQTDRWAFGMRFALLIVVLLSLGRAIVWPGLPAWQRGLAAACLIVAVWAGATVWRGRSEALVVIDEKGIDDSRSSAGIIAWHQIKSIWVEKPRGYLSECLCLHVDDSGKLGLTKGSFLGSSHRKGTFLLPKNRSKKASMIYGEGSPSVAICFWGLTPGAREVVAYVSKIHPEKIAGT